MHKKFEDEVLEFDQMSYDIARAEQASNHMTTPKNLLVQPVPQMFQSESDEVPLQQNQERSYNPYLENNDRNQFHPASTSYS